ncbi:hypothetical protein FYJ34_04145 [Clostridiaceae bacterium 68-1-5]|uniref:DHHW protein n=1 Tax=Suipraeoptans intestinalis TaxID=2606628 RepID=A0A6N7V004_9FIRM|nr:DHHW family protein [Suipraeoptans intestinalis]MDY3122547.1 DHHW family protein [Suipraeoptans intestinalis]MSR93477.1 hypothetical protein [Suipraeoptans intestinalis]
MKRGNKRVGIIFLTVILALAVLGPVIRDKKISEEENRTLAQRPELTFHGVLSGNFMKKYEAYVSDQFVGRSVWRIFHASLKRIGGNREENGVYLGKNGQLLEKIEPPKKEYVENTVRGMNDFQGRYPEVTMRMMLVPDAGEILQEKLPPLVRQASQTDMIEGVREELSPGIRWVEAQRVMEDHKEENIYYKTDHHWTGTGVFYAFLEYGKEAELPLDESAYKKYPVTTQFNGALSKTSGFRRGEKEKIELYLPKEDHTKYVVSYVENQKKRTSLYDEKQLDTQNGYQVFQGGNYSLLDIRTDVKNTRRLLLVKDSFANSFVPFLTPFYQEIVMVDPRYYAGNADELMDTYGINEVLFLYSGNTFFQDNNIGGFLKPVESGSS